MVQKNFAEYHDFRKEFGPRNIRKLIPLKITLYTVHNNVSTAVCDFYSTNLKCMLLVTLRVTHTSLNQKKKKKNAVTRKSDGTACLCVCISIHQLQ